MLLNSTGNAMYAFIYLCFPYSPTLAMLKQMTVLQITS